MTIAENNTATEKPATRRAQIGEARGRVRLETAGEISPSYRPAHIRFSAAHSEGSNSDCGAVRRGLRPARGLYHFTRSFVSG